MQWSYMARLDSGYIVIILTGLTLWAFGWPRAHIDDLFFSGTAIELARGGIFTNPWLASWLTDLDTVKNYSQPTFLPYALAGWLKLCGISTLSLTAFHMAVQTLLCLTVYRSVCLKGAPRIAGLAVVIMLLLALTRYGMRPDALALLLIVGSGLTAARSHPGLQILGGFLGAAAVATQPFALTLVIPLHLVVLLRNPERSRWIIATGIGLVLALILFTLSIHGEWREFLRVFLQHSQMVTPDLSNSLAYLADQLTFGFEAWRQLLGLLIIASVVAVCRKGRAIWLNAWLVWFGMIVLGCTFYSTYMLHYAVQGGLILALLSAISENRRALSVLIFFFAACWLQAGLWLQMAAPGADNLSASDSLRSEIAGRQPELLLLDATSMRRLYDFRPTYPVEDFVHYRPQQKSGKLTPDDIEPGVLICATAHHFETKASGFSIRAKRVTSFGRTLGSLPATPETLVIHPPLS